MTPPSRWTASTMSAPAGLVDRRNARFGQKLSFPLARAESRRTNDSGSQVRCASHVGQRPKFRVLMRELHEMLDGQEAVRRALVVERGRNSDSPLGVEHR